MSAQANRCLLPVAPAGDGTPRPAKDAIFPLGHPRAPVPTDTVRLSKVLQELGNTDISSASVLDAMLEKCSMEIQNIHSGKSGYGPAVSRTVLVLFDHYRSSFVASFISNGALGKYGAARLPGALDDLAAAARVAQWPEEHASISRVRLSVLLLIGRNKEAVAAGRELAGHLLRAKDDAPGPPYGPLLRTTPSCRSECAKLIERAERAAEAEAEAEAGAKAEHANAERAVRAKQLDDSAKQTAQAKELYDSAGALMAKGQYAQAAEAAHGSVKLQPKCTKGYARLGQALERAGDFVTACRICVDAMKLDPKRHRSLLPALQAANKIARSCSEEFLHDLTVDRKCSACGATDGPLTTCSRCRIAHYCCKEHQRQRWPAHKLVCKALTEHVQDMADMARAAGPGGFVWGPEHRVQPQPKAPRTLLPG
eukprot:gene27731-7377_t